MRTEEALMASLFFLRGNPQNVTKVAQKSAQPLVRLDTSDLTTHLTRDRIEFHGCVPSPA